MSQFPRVESPKFVNRHGFQPQFITSVTSGLIGPFNTNAAATNGTAPFNPLDIFQKILDSAHTQTTTNAANISLDLNIIEPPSNLSFLQLFGSRLAADAIDISPVVRVFGRTPTRNWIPLPLYPLAQVPTYSILLDEALDGPILDDARLLFGGPTIFIGGCSHVLVFVETAATGVDTLTGTIPVLGRYFS
jgi:hypothetical protein